MLVPSGGGPSRHLKTISLAVPEKLEPLLYPKRYKGAYGGRGGAKSHFFAEQIVIRCFQRKTRVVCIREVQNSLKESSRQLIIDKIFKLGLEDQFEILEAEIRCRANGSLIIFKGMQSYNAANIKSLEGFDIAWVEEAQTMSRTSLMMLRPTIRKPGSELWFSWNPRYKTDPVDEFFRKSPSPEAISIAINWRDNPWFPDELRQDMEHDFTTDPDTAEHVWEGAYGASEGAILAKWINRAERDGRISDDIEFDPFGAPVEISADIGFRDTASWWFWQPRINGFAVLRNRRDRGMDAEDWVKEIEAELRRMGVRPEKLGRIWLPQDAKAKTFGTKHTSVERFIAKFGHAKVRIVPPSRKADQISAARAMVPLCRFAKTACDEGLDGLRAWEFEYDDENDVFSREPKHNWASHDGDGFAYGCQVLRQRELTIAEEPDRMLAVGPLNTVTLNDLWDAQKVRKRR